VCACIAVCVCVCVCVYVCVCMRACVLASAVHVYLLLMSMCVRAYVLCVCFFVHAV